MSRFDGRALLDFIREPSSRPFRVQEKSEEEEELEEFANFERYRDLIKHRRRGCRYLFGFSLPVLYLYKLHVLLPFTSLEGLSWHPFCFLINYCRKDSISLFLALFN